MNKKRAKVKPRFRSLIQALSSEKNLKNRSSPKAIEIRRNWQLHHKEHTLKSLAKFSFIPTSNGRWPGSWQTFQLDFLLQHFFRKSNHSHFLEHYLFTIVFVDTRLWKTKKAEETFPKFPSVIRVIDRSDRNPPITATSVTFWPSISHVSGLWLVDFDPICR